MSRSNFQNILLVAACSFFILVFVLFSPKTTHAATGDITDVRITSDGWYAEVDIEGFVTGGTADYGMSDDGNTDTVDNDSGGAKVIFTVTSQGYNTSGELGTITRTVYGTETLRKPFPNEAELDESASGGTLTIKVALSDFIYVDDKNGGAGTSGTDVTVSIPSGWYIDTGTGGSGATSSVLTNFTVENNSTLPYPKVIGRWAWPGYERVTSDFLVEAVAFHRFGQNGKPIAAIAFQANDQSSNSSYATTTDMTITTRSGDANIILVYAATMDIDALDQGEVIDINFTAYPWVGDESSILNSRLIANGGDGYAQPDERLGPLHALNDKSSTYGVGYAYVSRSTGNNTTGVVYSSQAAAESGNAYLTIGAAAAAIKTYHNSISGRNSASGGIILLAEGDHPYPGTVPSGDLGTTMDTWLTIKPASNAAKANTKISSGANGSSLRGTRIKVEGITLSPSVSSGGGMTGRVAGDVLWLHDNTINATGTIPFFAWRTLYATQNAVTTLSSGFEGDFSSSRGPFALVRGNNSTPLVNSHFYAVLGNKNVTGDNFIESTDSEVTNTGMASSTNVIFAFNTVYNLLSDVTVADSSTSTAIAIVQNVYERVAGDTSGVMSISASAGNGATTTNIIVWHNTFAGERHQWGYNSKASTTIPKLNWGSKFNIFTEQGIKSDDFTGDGGGDGNRTGNWPLTYNVGSVGNKSLTSSFEGEFHGLFAQWGPTHTYLTPGFIDDNSKNTGSNTGSGDYRLLSTSISIDSATTTDSMHMTLPYDLLGNPRYGSPDTGAYEYQPTYTMGVHEVATSSVVRMYGDEKWRAKTATSTNGTADFSITIPGTDRLEWLDVSIATWENTGTHQKVWTETSSTTGLTNTVHVIGDLETDTDYAVSVDGVVGQNITGDDCASGICTSNGSGEITFTYTGTYSTHTFEVEEQEDVTAPVVSSPLPSGEQVSGTTTVMFSVETDESATCKYGTTADTAYVSIANTFSTTGATSHSATTTVADGTSYTFYVRCSDGSGNANQTDTTIAFSIASAESESDDEEDEVDEEATSFKHSVVRIQRVQPQTVTTQPTPAINTVGGYSRLQNSTSDIEPGNTGIAVKELQSFLNTHGFIITPSGFGSPGNETEFFGALTHAAVIRFQEYYASEILSPLGFKKGTGIVGPATMKKINMILGSEKTPAAQGTGSTSEIDSTFLLLLKILSS